jgi:hypothetical protein
MKHIIVVETPDEDEKYSAADAKYLHYTVLEVVEALFERHYSAVFVQSRFCEDSAVVAVKKMYNVED